MDAFGGEPCRRGRDKDLCKGGFGGEFYFMI